MSSNIILNNSPAILETLEWRIDQEVVQDGIVPELRKIEALLLNYIQMTRVQDKSREAYQLEPKFVNSQKLQLDMLMIPPQQIINCMTGS